MFCKPQDYGFEGKTRKRIGSSNTERNKNKGVFGFVSGLESVIPGVKRVDDWTKNTCQQN